METKTCKVCGRELPLTEFRVTRWGGKAEVCNACTNEKRAQTRYERAQMGGARPLPFPTRTSTGKPRAKSGGRCAAPGNGSKAGVL